MSPRARVLHWFRTDLRVYDAPALREGLALNPEAWYPVWCWDPEYVFAHRVGVNRFNFLIESMNDLSRSLTKLNSESKLLVLRGSPYTLLPQLFSDWRITHLVYEIDTGGYAQERDKRVRELAENNNVKVISTLGHSLFHPAEIIEKNGGKATTTINQWQKAAGKIGSVPRPAKAPTELAPHGDLQLSSVSRDDHPVYRPHDLNQDTRIGPVTCFDTLTGPKGDFAIPTLEEIGYPRPTTTIQGGETIGRARLAAFNQDKKGNRAALFEKPKTSPAIPGPLGTSVSGKERPLSDEDDDEEVASSDSEMQIDVSKPSTTLMSPYLKFGCVGVRECWWSWHDIIVNAPKSANKPENLLGQLEFRDMYYAAELAVGGVNFAQVKGNSICRYMPWHCPTVYSDDGSPITPRPKDENHPRAEEWLAAWSEGRTGFPWIDALMRQLRVEGWMHHLGRHSVACFLTRGQCYISWERGAEVFDGKYYAKYLNRKTNATTEYLIDWDPASNYGNWMWLSCSAFFFLRVYGTVSWPSKFDKTGALVRKYVPELAKFPDKATPSSVQRTAGCIIGKDYPAPMLDEKEEKSRNIERMRAAYKIGLHGDAPEVLNGTAAGMFDSVKLEEDEESSRAGTKRKADKPSGGKSIRAKKVDGQKGLDAYIKRK